MPAKRTPPPAPVTNLAAAKSGDRRQALELLRDTLASALDECEPQMAAQIAGQYRACLADLAALAPSKSVPMRDQLAEKRKARRTSA